MDASATIRGRLVLLDLETTGLIRGKLEVIQIAACTLKHPTVSFNAYIVPTEAIPAAVVALTGFAKEGDSLTLRGRPVETVSRSAAVRGFLEFVRRAQSGRLVLVAHNAFGFDADHLIDLVAAEGQLPLLAELVQGFADTLPVFRAALPDRKRDGAFALGRLVKDFKVRVSGAPHNADHDVLVLKQLIAKIGIEERRLVAATRPLSSFVAFKEAGSLESQHRRQPTSESRNVSFNNATKRRWQQPSLAGPSSNQEKFMDAASGVCPVVYVAIETTGMLPGRNEVVQLAACAMRPAVSFNAYMVPARDISAEVTERCGLAKRGNSLTLQGQAVDTVTRFEAVQGFLDYLTFVRGGAKDKLVLLAHNAFSSEANHVIRLVAGAEGLARLYALVQGFKDVRSMYWGPLRDHDFGRQGKRDFGLRKLAEVFWIEDKLGPYYSADQDVFVLKRLVAKMGFSEEQLVANVELLDTFYAFRKATNTW